MTILAIMLSVAGCKTSEKNYREAYERAIEGKGNLDPADSTVYTRYRREMKENQAVVNGDTITVYTQHVAVTENGGGIKESLKRYNVVVGKFKQVFNARSMRERLAGNGYSGSFVVHTREPYYFVIAGSFSDPEEAISLLKKIDCDGIAGIKVQRPFLLEPAQMRR